MRSFLTARRNELRLCDTIYLLCVVLGIAICVFQYSFVSGFRKGEAYAVSERGSDSYLNFGQTFPDDFATIATKYGWILLIFGFAFVLRIVSDGRIPKMLSLTAFFGCFIPYWDVLSMKRLAFRYSDSARFDLFRETFPLDILIAAIVFTVVMIDAMSLTTWRNRKRDAPNSRDRLD